MGAASKADVVVAVCGDTSGIGYENDSGESVDRVKIGLSDEQRTLLKELRKLGKPIILVLSNGRPLELTFESQEMDAILEAWRPGMEGADAIADALFGRYNPGAGFRFPFPSSFLFIILSMPQGKPSLEKHLSGNGYQTPVPLVMA